MLGIYTSISLPRAVITFCYNMITNGLRRFREIGTRPRLICFHLPFRRQAGAVRLIFSFIFHSFFQSTARELASTCVWVVYITKIMIRILAVTIIGCATGKYALTDSDLEKFKCRKNAWQLPQSCGSTCSESDKTTLT